MSDENNKMDPIEQFFSRKVWDYDISYNESDWLDLEERLDIADRRQSSRIRRRWIAAAVVLLFAALGYFTYQNYLAIDRFNERLSSNTPTELQEEHASPGMRGYESGNQPNTTPSLVRPGRDRSVENSSENPIPTPSPSASKTLALGAAKNNASNASAGITKEEMGLYVNEVNCPECTLSPPVSDRAIPLSLTAADIAPSHTIASRSEESKDIPPIEAIGRSPLSVGVVVSPDLSTVGSGDNFSSPGYRIGVHAEYRLSPSLSITAGIMQSKVQYFANGDDYHPPSGYWTYGVVPDNLEGQCLMFDIPLNIKYRLGEPSTSKFFVSAGISSYIMLDEEYHFYYDRQYEGLVDSWSDKTGTRHWLSNANLSLGYEFELNRAWSLKAEPYIKLPLKKVGWGNVNLLSVGTFVSLNYKFGSTL